VSTKRWKRQTRPNFLSPFASSQPSKISPPPSSSFFYPKPFPLYFAALHLANIPILKFDTNREKLFFLSRVAPYSRLARLS